MQNSRFLICRDGDIPAYVGVVGYESAWHIKSKFPTLSVILRPPLPPSQVSGEQQRVRNEKALCEPQITLQRSELPCKISVFVQQGHLTPQINFDFKVRIKGGAWLAQG